MQPTQAPLKQTRARRVRRILFIGLPLLAVLGIAGYMALSQVPDDLDTSTNKASEAGLYRVSYEPNEAGILINQLQTWTLRVKTPEGADVTDATVTVDGDMPQHGHGLATSPVVTPQGGGSYLVEGLKFQMGGWWYTQFTITSPLGEDSARFDFVLK